MMNFILRALKTLPEHCNIINIWRINSDPLQIQNGNKFDRISNKYESSLYYIRDWYLPSKSEIDNYKNFREMIH
jgi:hypothetical protein